MSGLKGQRTTTLDVDEAISALYLSFVRDAGIISVDCDEGKTGAELKLWAEYSRQLGLGILKRKESVVSSMGEALRNTGL
mgnify:FL=1